MIVGFWNKIIRSAGLLTYYAKHKYVNLLCILAITQLLIGCEPIKFTKFYVTDNLERKPDSYTYQISNNAYHIDIDVDAYYSKVFIHLTIYNREELPLLFLAKETELYSDDKRIDLFYNYINEKRYSIPPDTVIVDDSCYVRNSYIVSDKPLSGDELFIVHIGSIYIEGEEKPIDLGRYEFYWDSLKVH